MRSNEFNLAIQVGKIFSDYYKNEIKDDWTESKELATITEKAIKFSERSGNALYSCVSIKLNEMKNGYILVKDHEDDDFARGFYVGYYLDESLYTSENNESTIIDEVEKIYAEKTINVEWQEYYQQLIVSVSNKHWYKNQGYITVQQLTRICLSMMDEGLGDMFVISKNFNNVLSKVSGVVTDSSIIDEYINEGARVKAEEVIMLIA